MKKIILGVGLGFVFAFSTGAFASDAIHALLFPASFEINGTNHALNNDYKVLNVDGHAYVPIRFVAENLGATIDYDSESQKIIVKNKSLDLKDPAYQDISVGNLILTSAGTNTKVTGQLKMEGVGSSKNMIGANLSFYNDNSKKIGEAVINGDDFGVDSQTFVSEGAGDFRAYSTVNLHIGAVNHHIIPEAPSIVYENTKYHFTLQLPKRWEGKFDVVNTVNEESNMDLIDFINKTNQAYGGVHFTIAVWSKEEWNANSEERIRNGHISKIGENDGHVFTLSTPSDVEYNPQDEKSKLEFLSMYEDINTIKTSFKLKDEAER